MEELIDFPSQLRKQNSLHILRIYMYICFSHSFLKSTGLNSVKPFKIYNYLNRPFWLQTMHIMFFLNCFTHNWSWTFIFKVWVQSILTCNLRIGNTSTLEIQPLNWLNKFVPLYRFKAFLYITILWGVDVYLCVCCYNRANVM